MAAVCPHRPFALDEARLVGDALECPLHGRRYGPNGTCVSRPETAPVRTFAARDFDGQVWLLS
jgi:vanillate O-demethylase monooxygenase subunit